MKKASKDHLLVLGCYSDPIAVNIHPYLIVFALAIDFYLYFIRGVLYGVFKKTNTDIFLSGLKHDKSLDTILQNKCFLYVDFSPYQSSNILKAGQKEKTYG